MRPSWWPPLIFKTFSWGLFGHPRSLQGGEKVPSWLLRARGRPQNRSTPVLQGGRAPWALPPCKTGVNLACARGIVNMESIGLVAICGAPSGDLEAPKQFFKKGVQLKIFLVFLALSEVATAPCKNAVNRACGHLGGPLGFSKLLSGAASGTPGASREGKKLRLGSFEPAVVRRTDRLHFCNGFWRPGPSHPVKMQSVWPSHGAL